MLLNYLILFFIDLAILAVCLGLMVRHGQLRALHPATLYFFFHAYTFTFRLFQLARGAPTLFENWGLQLLNVSHAEMQRAGIVAWLTMITMTAVWIYLNRRSAAPVASAARVVAFRPFSRRLMWLVISFTLPVGLLGLVLFPGHVLAGSSDPLLGEWTNSGYVVSMYQWFGMSLMALVFYYGFRLVLMLPLLLYLVTGLLNFPARVMVIVPILFIVFTYLKRSNQGWRRPAFVLTIAATALLFVAGKELGPLLREGNLAGAQKLVVGRLGEWQSGTHNDNTFMDMLAVTMTHIDERGRFYYGGTYSSLLVLPVPRVFWPNKPGQADWRKDIQTRWRPTGQMGMIVTFIGEAYANFGYLGIILYAIVLAKLLHMLYGWILGAPYFSLANFWSLCVYAILIQIFRDGLASFVIFQASLLLPLTIISVLHLAVLRPRKVSNGTIIGWSSILDGPQAFVDAKGRTIHFRYASRQKAR